MLNADVHLLLLRPTRVPVAGEAVSEGFQGQVELDGWSWSFHNEDERKRASDKDDRYQKTKNMIDSSGSAEFRKHVARVDSSRLREQAKKDHAELLRTSKFDTEEDRKKFIAAHNENLEKQAKALDEELKDIENPLREKPKTKSEDEWRSEVIAELDRNENFEFSFSKRVDISTTQLLNSMKSGDVFPSGVLTIHQRSTNAGLSLVINVQRVRLLDYNLKCETSETMTTMREEWTAEFGALAYVYKSKDMVYLSSSLSQNVPRAMTQGQVRAFTMKNIGSPI